MPGTMAWLALRAFRIQALTTAAPVYADVGRQGPGLLSAYPGQRLLAVLIWAPGRLVQGPVRGAHLAISPSRLLCSVWMAPLSAQPKSIVPRENP